MLSGWFLFLNTTHLYRPTAHAQERQIMCFDSGACAVILPRCWMEINLRCKSPSSPSSYFSHPKLKLSRPHLLSCKHELESSVTSFFTHTRTHTCIYISYSMTPFQAGFLSLSNPIFSFVLFSFHTPIY